MHPQVDPTILCQCPSRTGYAASPPSKSSRTTRILRRSYRSTQGRQPGNISKTQRTHQQDEHCPISERHNPPISTCHPHSGVLTLHTQTEHRQSPQQGKFYGILLLHNPHWAMTCCSKHSQVFAAYKRAAMRPYGGGRWHR